MSLNTGVPNQQLSSLYPYPSPCYFNNISEKLFHATLADCTKKPPAPCCLRDMQLQSLYVQKHGNKWTPSANYNERQNTKCTDQALYKQSLLANLYKIASGNLKI